MWTQMEIGLKVNDQKETEAGQLTFLLSHRMQHMPMVGTDKMGKVAHHPLSSLYEKHSNSLCLVCWHGKFQIGGTYSRR